MRKAYKSPLGFRNLILSVSLILVCSTNTAVFEANLKSGVNFFNYANRIIPHPDKIQKGGEDAIYSDEKILVVADGVGGWNDVGIDPGLYSDELC